MNFFPKTTNTVGFTKDFSRSKYNIGISELFEITMNFWVFETTTSSVMSILWDFSFSWPLSRGCTIVVRKNHPKSVSNMFKKKLFF